MNLDGIFPALTTPFSASGEVDIGHFRENLLRYNKTGLAGYVVNGSTGESVLLSWKEVETLWEAARVVATPGKLLIAGTGTESTKETIERTRRAAEMGFDAALVRTPHYYKPQTTPEALTEFFLRVADSSRIPILIYSVPAFTGITVEAPLAARLASHRNIIGMKDSSGSVTRAAEIVQAAPDRFRLLVGSASTLKESLECGAAGAVLALACAFPELCVEIYKATRGGDAPRATALQDELTPASDIILTQHGVPGLKYALDCLGYYGGPPRSPLLPVSESAKREIGAVVARLSTASASA